MKNNKSIVYFDIESTGLSRSADRIIELYMLKVNADGSEQEFYSKFDPHPVEIHKEALAVHGISNEDLIGEPQFRDKAKEVEDFINGCDLSGYNIVGFDIPMLFEEFYRAGIIHQFKDHRVFDSWYIWREFEPRNLTGAVKSFLNEKFEKAHSAKHDVLVSKRVLEAQLKKYEDEYESLDELDEKMNKERSANLDFSGKFIRVDNDIHINFGKHKGLNIEEVFDKDSGYFKWIAENDSFSSDTRIISKKIYAKLSS